MYMNWSIRHLFKEILCLFFQQLEVLKTVILWYVFLEINESTQRSFRMHNQENILIEQYEWIMILR